MDQVLAINWELGPISMEKLVDTIVSDQGCISLCFYHAVDG